MSTLVEDDFDKMQEQKEAPEVYMVIADAHNRYGGASDSLDRRIPLPIADGTRYLNTTINNIKLGMELVEKGVIKKVVLNGDIIDHIMGEGPNEIHEYVRLKLKSKDEATDQKVLQSVGKYEANSEFMSYVKKYLDTTKMIRKGIAEDSVSFIMGNHEYKPKLIEMGIDYQTELITPNFIFSHGHPHDYFLDAMALGPKGILYNLFAMDKLKGFPGAKTVSKWLKNFGRVIGFGMYHGNEFIQKLTNKLSKDPQFIKDLETKYEDNPKMYKFIQSTKNNHALKGLAHARMYHFMKPLLDDFKERKDYNSQMLVTGHEHDNYLGDNIISLGNLYSFGAHFIGVGPKGQIKLIEGTKGSKQPLEAGEPYYDKLFSEANLISYQPDAPAKWRIEGKKEFNTTGKTHMKEITELIKNTYGYRPLMRSPEMDAKAPMPYLTISE